MKLVEIDIHLPEELQAFVRSQVQSGRYGSEDEVMTAAVYLLIQELERQGFTSPESRAILERPIDRILAELRQALAEKEAEDTPEILDIGEVIARWDEIMSRVEAGESFVISINGEPKAKLEPIAPSR